ncbi:hypothetical protein [Aquimarina sp. I32.4]|uniref:hypothetical protein n=1 Tax=Aquimarina sp. I32.4 TaxID=2053903 RepID=UPI000CDEAAA7|nr:hypothetical protein [Aquimarina sp. I32.4]
MEKIYSVDSKEVKSIYIGKDAISFCKLKENNPERFIHFYKYPEIMEKTTKFKFHDIKEIKIRGGIMYFKGFCKVEDIMIYWKEIAFDSEQKALDFSTQLDQLDVLKKKVKTEKKLNAVFNSSSFYIFIFGLCLVYLTINGEANLGESAIRSRNKLAGKILDSLFNFLGPTVSILFSILIVIFAIYFMWKKFKTPLDIITFKEK